MHTLYFSNGNLQDTVGAGLNVQIATQNDDESWLAVGMSNGQPYHGYQAVEISEERYNELQAQLAKPNEINYFWGAIGPVGLVDAATHATIVAAKATAKAAYIAEQVLACRLQFKISGHDALVLNEPHRDVFELMYPDILPDIVNALFEIN